jgi:RNA ligase (TIGR02306 family)
VKLATIETISSLRHHPNADSLDIAKILGWQCIVKRGAFTEGQNVVFVPIDTILPDAPWSAFLKKGDKPIRLGTVKLRGEYSQGLVLPLDVLPSGSRGWHVGADVGGELGIKKYEKEVPAQLSGEVLSPFPQYLASKTDEDNGLSHPELVETVLATQSYNPLLITQKLDGSSCTIIVENGKILHVCSRNLSLKESDSNAFWKAAKKGNFEAIPYGPQFTGIVQGELMGPGIQGNQLGLSEPTLFVFQIKANGEWIPYGDMEYMASLFGFRCVEAIKPPLTFDLILDDLQVLADVQVLPNGKPAEGIVVRPGDCRTSGIGRPLGFKIINRNYKDL